MRRLRPLLTDDLQTPGGLCGSPGVFSFLEIYKANCEGAEMENLGTIGTSIITAGKTYIDLASPSASSVHAYDIAAALSKLCRYCGHSPHFYSVAEHSVRCHDYAESLGLDEATCFAALLHDSAEAYLGDVSRPLKLAMRAWLEKSQEESPYDVLEAKMRDVIYSRFGLSTNREQEEMVGRIDFALLISEKHAFFGDAAGAWSGEELVTKIQLRSPVGWLPQLAEEAFLSRFRRYADC